MQRLVIDTNYLGEDGLASYLAASKHNYGLISPVTMIEVHKEFAAHNTRHLMHIACQFPRQIKILRDLSDLTYMDGSTDRLARRLIDENQTKKFPSYCTTIISAPLDDVISTQFSLFEEQASGYIAELSERAARIFNLFRMAEKSFTENDAFHLRKRRRYPEQLQMKIVHLAFAIREVLINGIADKSQFPSDVAMSINTYLFRYSLFVALFFARWIRTGRADIRNPDRLINQILDMKIGAIATFFDGLLTRDTALAEMYEEALFVSSGLGGYVRCGRGAEG